MNNEEKRITEIAVEAAMKAGTILKGHAHQQLKVNRKHDHDLKLEVDTLCEEAILDTLHQAFPHHSVLAEESGQNQKKGTYQWIIDPLDGTVNFFHGLPYFCVSIACFAHEDKTGEGGFASLGRPVAGVVYAPPTDELFVGKAGEGATLNGRPIRVSRVDALSDAVLSMGFGKTEALGRDMTQTSSRLAGKVRKLRCFGAAAYDISNVACGRLSGFYEKGLRTWDLAAGGIILKEAGGVFDVDEFIPTKWWTLAVAPGIHEALKAMVSSGIDEHAEP